MPVTAAKAGGSWPAAAGWCVQDWMPSGVHAGVACRDSDPARLFDAYPHPVITAEAEQAHGASFAVMLGRAPQACVAGCDALLTHQADVALRVRTADCLPLFFADLARRVIGLAHAGWRGIAAWLPARMVAAFHDAYRSRPEDLRVAVGPAIRACCYDVGPEFEARFGRFVTRDGGRRRCDLVAAAIAQLRGCGVRPAHVVDSHRCTACEPQQWFSLRRDGPATGRLVSCILMPS